MMTRLYSDKTPVFVIILVTLFWQCASHAEEYSGLTRWVDTTSLAMPVSGVVQEIYVKKGQLVNQGQELLTLDLTTFKSRTIACEAAVKANIELGKEARKEYARNKELYEQLLLSEHKLQLTHIAMLVSEADYQQVKSDCVLLEQDLTNATLRAPIKGLVLDIKTAKGAVVSQYDAPQILLTMTHAERILLEVNVSGDVLDGLSIDQTLDVLLEGQSVKGRVVGIEYEPRSLGKLSYRIIIEFNRPQGLSMRPGHHASVSIPRRRID